MYFILMASYHINMPTVSDIKNEIGNQLFPINIYTHICKYYSKKYIHRR